MKCSARFASQERRLPRRTAGGQYLRQYRTGDGEDGGFGEWGHKNAS